MRGFIACFLGVAFCFLAIAPVSGEVCATVAAVEDGELLSFDVGSAWAGTTVAYAATARRDFIFIGYFDAQRWLTVARLELAARRICSVRVASRFEGWDTHNLVRLALDGDDILHVAGNMHAKPLVYARARRPLSLDGLETLQPMTGRNEERVTYPLFFRDGDGSMLFLYRDGFSGDGAWFVNRYVRGRWKRGGDQPIFSDHWNGAPLNAYPTAPIMDARGNIHLAIVWRQGPDVTSNVALTYVVTRDFATFTSARGGSFRPPLDPDSGDMVDDTGPKAGLFNNQRLGIDPTGEPVIVYHRYGPDGRNTIIAARPEGRSWRKAPIATGKHLTVYKGKGTIPDSPGLTDIVFDDQIARVNVRMAREASRSVWFNSQTLDVVEPPANFPRLPSPRAAKVPAAAGLREPHQINIPVHCAWRGKQPAIAMLSYVTQPPNRDQRPECDLDAPQACAPPPSRLILAVPSAAANAILCTP